MSTTKRPRLERSSDNKDVALPTCVYYKVHVYETIFTQETRVKINIEGEDGVDVIDIKKAIKNENSNAFASIDASDIELFESEQDMEQENPLQATMKWNSTVTWGTDKKPLFVKALVKRISESPRSNSKALEAAIEKHFSAPITPFQDNETHLYMIDGDDGVMGQQAWIGQLPTRFEDGLTNGILYRPKIVNEIIAMVVENLSKPVKKGLMIKGPQGIGKSHSIVSVVRKLQSTGNYLVTFIPDCGNWGKSDDLIDAICSSFGFSHENLDLHYFKERNAYNDEQDFRKFINAVDNALKSKDKQWVFVFDQINRLFARFQDKKDVGVLDFPYRLIMQVMARDRITSIISASANNEIAYKDRHEGFEEYFHRTDMTNEEIELVFSDIADDEKQLTGNVPLYIHQIHLRKVPTSSLQASVMFSLTKLCDQLSLNGRSMLKNSMCQILLGLTFAIPLLFYDRKYFVEVYDETQNKWSYRPLLPLVEDAAREFFWADLMKYIEMNESSMLQVMKQSHTTNDTKGRIFEGLVIQRCLAEGVRVIKGAILPSVLTIQNNAHVIIGQNLPQRISDGIHIPINCNFPAVDMVWKVGKRVFGVQIHTSRDHGDAAPKFLEMCNAAQWFSEKSTIYLVYLSPNETCSMTTKISEYPGTIDSRSRRHQGNQGNRILIKYITVSSVGCLKSLENLLSM